MNLPIFSSRFYCNEWPKWGVRNQMEWPTKFSDPPFPGTQPTSRKSWPKSTTKRRHCGCVPSHPSNFSRANKRQWKPWGESWTTPKVAKAWPTTNLWSAKKGHVSFQICGCWRSLACSKIRKKPPNPGAFSFNSSKIINFRAILARVQSIQKGPWSFLFRNFWRPCAE